jgi:TolA-binding protein
MRAHRLVSVAVCRIDMDVNLLKVLSLFLLAVAIAPAVALADAADDQYAVAAGHYSQHRWELALDEFHTFTADYPQNTKAAQARFYQGECLVQLKRFAEAGTYFRELFASGPEDRIARKALFRAAESSYFAGQSVEARRDLEKFLARDPSDKLNAYVLPYLGDVVLEQGDPAAARKLFSQGLDQFPHGPLADDCRYGLARAFEKQGDIDEARRLYLALSSRPNSEWADDAQFCLGMSQYAAKEYAEAAKTFAVFESTFRESPLAEKALLGRGQAEYQLKDYAQAEQIFRRLAASPALGIEAGYWLGLAQTAQHDWQAAAQTLLAVAAKDEKHALAPAIVFHAGDALARAGNRPAALEQFERVRRQWPESEFVDDCLLGEMRAALAAADGPAVDAAAKLLCDQFPNSDVIPAAKRLQARSFLARKDFPSAAEVLRSLAGQEADQDETGASQTLADRYLLALALQGQAKYQDVPETLAPLLSSDDMQLTSDAQRLSATALIAMGRYGDAIEPLKTSLQRYPDEDDSPQAYAQLAICCARTNQLDRARRAYHALLGHKPGEELRRATALSLAEAALDQNDHPWADELFASLANTDGQAWYAVKGLSGLAWSQYKAGDFAASAETCQQLLEKYPADELAPQAALLRGQILSQQGDVEPALAMYESVVERYGQSEQLAPALLGAARIHEELGHHERAADLYGRLVEEFPEFSERDLALYNRAWVLRSIDQLSDADRQFEQLRTEYPQSRYWADAVYRLAERAMQTGEEAQAKKLLAELLGAKPEEEIAAHALYLQAQIAVAASDWSEVGPPLARLVDKFPNSSVRLLAEFWQAEGAYQLKNYEPAAQRFAALAQCVQGQSGEKKREAWMAMIPLRRAQIMVHEKQWPEAQEMAQSVTTDFPGFRQQYEVDYVLARCLASQAKFDEARAVYRQVIRSPQGSKTETAAMSQWMIGESFFHQKKYDLALREYLRLEILYAYPTWQAAALLQAGKCHEALGQWSQATQLYARILKNYPDTTFARDARQRLQTASTRVDAK